VAAYAYFVVVVLLQQSYATTITIVMPWIG